MRNIFIQGIDTLLGAYFAARCLQASEDQIFYCPEAVDALSGEITDFVSHAARRITKGTAAVSNRQEIENRLERAGRDLDVRTSINEVWYFANSRVSRSRAETLEALISACPKIGAKEFNYVEFDNAGRGSESDTSTSIHNGFKPTESLPDHQIEQGCKARSIGYRIFNTSLLVGNGHPRLEQSGAALLQFLSVLHSFKTEIEERSPQYFDFQALRCFAPGEAALNLVTADVASDLLLRIARTDGTANASFPIVSPQNTPFSALCERIGVAYGLGLLSVQDFSDLSAIDRAFHQRSGNLQGYLLGGAPESPGLQAYQAANLPSDSVLFDEESQITLFESLRRNQDEAWTARKKRVADLPGKLVNRTLARNGTQLNYYIGGSTGTAVVLLNALGQGLEFWYRLMDCLMESHRVIIWEPRGTISPPPPFGVTDQVDDLDAILQHENIETCHLVGWCTGPKVAIEFHLRRPSAVRSMAFLNGTFKCDGGSKEFDSPYEQNLESLCRMLARKPAMAASVMKTFQSRVEASETEMLEGSDREQMSVSVLSLMSADLRPHVLAPFKTEETTLNYAHQLIDFWSHDSWPKASAVRIPVLFMGTEYDQVATPATSQMAAGIFPNARHVHVDGATHYCLYDRPEFVAGLLKTFFKNPDDLPVAQRAQDEVAQTQ